MQQIVLEPRAISLERRRFSSDVDRAISMLVLPAIWIHKRVFFLVNNRSR